MPVGVTRQELQGCAEIYGNVRSKRGEEFGRAADRNSECRYYYVPTGGALSIIVLWGGGLKDTGVTVFSCARTYMNPTIELYRYLSGWRTTSPFATPYLMEYDGYAVVMCAREFNAMWFNKDDAVPKTLYSTIDMVTEMSSLIGQDLVKADGGRIEDLGMSREEVVDKVYNYWSVSVPGLHALYERSGGAGGVGYDPS